jgi:hypothetical protein
MIMTLQKNNVVVIRTLRMDMLMGNFHPMEVILTSWKISFKLCKLLFLQHHYNVNE